MTKLESVPSRHDQKLEFILRTAARIFAEKSYHSTSMRDISRATNVSLAGLYHYCKSKEELLFLIQDNCFGRVLERLEQQLQELTIRSPNSASLSRTIFRSSRRTCRR